jgi:hypothetical protein
MKVNSNAHEYAILCNSEYGPTFGRDIRIFNNPNTTMDSVSYLGECY